MNKSSTAPLDNGVVIRLCCGLSCGEQSDALAQAIRQHISNSCLGDHVVLLEHYCFGRCALAPNLVVERWKDGAPNQEATVAFAMNQEHPDLRLESSVRATDIPALIDWHVAEWRKETM